MNRADFLKTMLASLAVMPGAVSLAQPLPPRSLVEWLNDEMPSEGCFTVHASSDVVEYFREHAGEMKRADNGYARFVVEQRPYRWSENQQLENPYSVTMEAGGDVITRFNPDWLNAPTEFVIAYHGSTIHFCPFDRKTFTVLPA
jgi:hypothetical protein